MTEITIQPRVIRMKQAPAYLGMCLREFNEKVRPNVREFKIGIQGIGFVREDLDRWLDDHLETNAIDKEQDESHDVASNGRRHVGNTGGKSWREKQSAAYTKGTVSGTSTKSSGVSDFTRALELARGKRQSAI